MVNKIIIGVLVLSVGLIVWSRYAEKQSVVTDETVLSANGVHWHPKLAISVRGEEVAIPANIGLVGGHSPMHTHETDGTIHLEFEGVVREDDTRLARFFELWGKEFSSERIFEHANSETERVRMYVNGEVNTEFEQYMLKDADLVEIKFE